MNIREAILKTADLFERKPEMFNFMESRIPHDCGTPGCAIGWMGYFLGAPRDALIIAVFDLIGIDDSGFYVRMSELSELGPDGEVWTRSPSVCAETLRLYADRYHPASPTVYRPGADVVRSMLEEVA